MAVVRSSRSLPGQRFGSVGEGLALLDLRHECPQDVDRGQQNVGEWLDFVESAASKRAEEVFHGVCQLGHPAVADRRRRALERVGGTEDFVDHARIDVMLEFEQALFDALDLLQGLVGEQTVVARLQIEGQLHVTQPLGARRGA